MTPENLINNSDLTVTIIRVLDMFVIQFHTCKSNKILFTVKINKIQRGFCGAKITERPASEPPKPKMLFIVSCC